MAVEEPAVVEKLRALAQYQLAVHPPYVPGSFAKKTLNTFLAKVADADSDLSYRSACSKHRRGNVVLT